MAPLKWMIPSRFWTAALLVLNGALVQPLISVSGVKPLSTRAKDAPSRYAKHWALLNVPPSACMSTVPLAVIWSRPLVALQRSTGTYTSVAGLKPSGSTNGCGLILVAIATLFRSMPARFWTVAVLVLNGALVQPLMSVNGVEMGCSLTV